MKTHTQTVCVRFRRNKPSNLLTLEGWIEEALGTEYKGTVVQLFPADDVPMLRTLFAVTLPTQEMANTLWHYIQSDAAVHTVHVVEARS